VKGANVLVGVRERFDVDYNRFFADLTTLCRALGAGSAAEDIAQESILHARERHTQLRDESKLEPWLRRIAARRTFEYLRRQRRHEAGGLDDPVVAFLPSDPSVSVDIAAAITRLPERERVAVVLVYALGYEQEEAAAVMSVTRGTVATLLHRARRHLAERLAAYATERDLP
jgi:RNA polymerase sigma-70 factor (ECF subfamily)